MPIQQHTDIELPDALWEHELFADPVSYPEITQNLTAARVDAELRRQYHMPSTGDDSAGKALDALQRIYQDMRQKLAGELDPPPEVASSTQCRHRLVRLISAFENGNPGPLELRMLDRICPELIKCGALQTIPDGNTSIGELLELLHQAELLLLDQIASSHPALKERYKQDVYNAIDNALAYNSTADTTRIKPVIAWIREVLGEQNITHGLYADVGCSVETGAENTLVAADALRPEYCSQIHGVDIVEPAPELTQNMQGQHDIHLYRNDTIESPLPREYDIILLANVHRHLTREDQQALLTNLTRSLKDNGLLFINWRFNQQSSPCILLQRKNNALAFLAEKNCL